ncbi:hypothetical protein [Micromonospora sp. KC213]|uniref:hypothetical protein n=1 Tax=Micromonospora sp. KC213 TaxID=2530378 RepID=UPI001044BD60|nr:hypothetical protein [Micromonospora sp. KC213]TDC44253.1 hypothetical protein E1166_00165 [Micromonospora sp. KC213]
MDSAGVSRGVRLVSRVSATDLQVRPLLPDVAHDGSQAVLIDVLRHFSETGVRVTVYCGTQPGLPEVFNIFSGVAVRPVLGFNSGTGGPYWTPPVSADRHGRPAD